MTAYSANRLKKHRTAAGPHGRQLPNT